MFSPFILKQVRLVTQHKSSVKLLSVLFAWVYMYGREKWRIKMTFYAACETIGIHMQNRLAT